MYEYLCLNCFKMKGEYEVCPHCGYVQGSAPKQAYHLPPGTILENRYIIGTCIGFGGFGITYRAYDTVLNIQIAVKEFYPSGLVNRAPGDTKVGIFSGEKKEEFEQQLERFLDEARNMAIFSKERDIVNVYHFFQANGTAYTIMEYIEGTLLKQYLKEHGRMEVREAVGYMVPILNALEKIHKQGIVHKDISPDNIFLTGEDTVKIFDFGAARFPAGQKDKTFSVIIKAGYAPPEQYRSQYEPGAFMDIYAAGAVFYEMITGVKPSEGSDRAIEDDLKPPSKLGIEMDANLEKIVMKALCVKPEHRFQTAEEFKNCIINNTKVLLPDEEMKRLAHKRAMRIGIGAAGAAAVAIAALAGVTGYLGRNKLHASSIKADTLSVWLISDQSERGLAADQSTKAALLLEENFEKSCPKVTLEITEIPREEYQAKLESACQDGTLPDVFCTDYLPGEAWEYCGEAVKLWNTLDMDNYKYLDQFAKESCEVPTGVQVQVAYQNYAKLLAEGKLPDQTVAGDEFSSIPSASQIPEEEYANFGDARSDQNVLAADLSCFEKVSNVTLRATPAQEIVVAPIVDGDGKLQASFCGCYGVNKDSSKNQQEAGLLCISYLLNPAIQEETYLTNYQALPVEQEALKRYQDLKLNGYLEFVNDYIDNLSFVEE